MRPGLVIALRWVVSLIFLAGYYLVGSYSVTLGVVRGMGATPIVGAGNIASEEGKQEFSGHNESLCFFFEFNGFLNLMVC